MSCNCGKNQAPKRPQNPYAQRAPVTVYNTPNQAPPTHMPPNYAPPYPNHPYPY